MSTEPDKAPRTAEPHLSVLASEPDVRSKAAAGRAEAQLRARVEQLEAALADVSRCLADAERRAAEVLSIQARVQSLQSELAAADERLRVIVTSKSWRLTTPLRRGMGRVRRSPGR